jgi:hypothetical protein
MGSLLGTQPGLFVRHDLHVVGSEAIIENWYLHVYAIMRLFASWKQNRIYVPMFLIVHEPIKHVAFHLEWNIKARNLNWKPSR